MLRDEIKQETVKMKDRSFKEKLEYFWTYYRYHTLAAILILILVVNFINNVIKAPKMSFMTAFINTTSYGSQKELQKEASEALGFDVKKESVSYNMDVFLGGSLSSGAAGANTLTTLLFAKDLDVMVAEPTGVKWIHDSRVMAPLDTVLSEAFLTEYADRIVVYTDEETGESFPAFLKLPDDSRVYSFDIYPPEVNGNLYVSIACTTQRAELIEPYLRYLFEAPAAAK